MKLMNNPEKERLRFAIGLDMLLGGLMVLFALMGYNQAFGEVQEYDFLPVPNVDGTYRMVEIRYVDTLEESCGTVWITACHKITEEDGKTVEYIEFWRGHEYDRALLGGNTMTHELLHAWGVSHSEMEMWFNTSMDLSPIIMAEAPDFPRLTGAISSYLFATR